MGKKLIKIVSKNFFSSVIIITFLISAAVPFNYYGQAHAQSIPTGCVGGASGPVSPDTTCPNVTPEYSAVVYCRSKAGLSAPVPTYNPSTADKSTACARGYLAGYNNGSKTNTCNAISLAGTSLTGIYIPNGVVPTPGITPSPGGSLFPGIGGATGPSSQDAVNACKKAYDEGKNQVDADASHGEQNANQVCNKTASDKKDQCLQDLKDCKKKPKNKQAACFAGLATKYPADTDAAGDDETQDCSGEGLSLGWILCPVVEVVSNFGQDVFKNFIQPMMEQNVLSLDTNDPFYKSWQGFRFLGNVLLIGSLLAIVYSQTRGGGN